jgi:hypothetical protein
VGRRRLAINRYSQGDMDSLDGLASHQTLLGSDVSCTFGEHSCMENIQ